MKEKRIKKTTCFCLLILVIFPTLALNQEYRVGEKVKVAITKNPFGAAESIMAEGLIEHLMKLGCEIALEKTFSLTQKEQEYSGWARDALAARHMGNLISEYGKNEFLTVALLSNCANLPGILGGLQHMGPGREKEVYHLAANVPHRIGLVYFDAHADINTP